jgi:hypothetical protein
VPYKKAFRQFNDKYWLFANLDNTKYTITLTFQGVSLSSDLGRYITPKTEFMYLNV